MTKFWFTAPSEQAANLLLGELQRRYFLAPERPWNPFAGTGATAPALPWSLVVEGPKSFDCGLLDAVAGTFGCRFSADGAGRWS